MCLERKRYAGTLTCDGEPFDIAFACWGDDDFRIQIEAEPISRDLYLRLAGTSGAPGSSSVQMVLEGRSEDGWTFHSGRTSERGFGFGTHYWVTLGAHVTTITMPSERSQDALPVKCVWLRGYASCRNPDVETPLGLLRVSGNPCPTSHDAVSGDIVLEAHEAVDGWSDAADDFLNFVHLGLAFGQGHRLQAPRRDLWADGVMQATYTDGTAFPM